MERIRKNTCESWEKKKEKNYITWPRKKREWNIVVSAEKAE